MIEAVFKFVAVWFAALLLSGAVVFFSSSGVDALDPAIEIERQKNCDKAETGFESGGKAQCLEQVERYLESELGDARSNLIYWHAMAGIVVLLIGAAFIVQIVQRSTTAGMISDFRSMKKAWFGHLLAVLFAVLIAGILAHVTDMFGQWATILNAARGWGIPALMVLVWPAVFWGGTLLGTPDKMRPSIPGA